VPGAISWSDDGRRSSDIAKDGAPLKGSRNGAPQVGLRITERVQMARRLVGTHRGQAVEV
jgi:hypothetical protein